MKECMGHLDRFLHGEDAADLPALVKAALTHVQFETAGSALRVHAALRERPVISLTEICRRTGLSFPAATTGMGRLLKLGVTRELTGRRRNRLFAYEHYLRILNEGTEQV